MGEKIARSRRKKGGEPDFITKSEIAYNLRVSLSAIDRWIWKDKTFPPPHSSPGARHVVWLRRHYNAYRDHNVWPEESFGS